ncbi:hypothetical protein ACTOV0_02220 [Arcanobacterium canis]
MDHRSVSSTGDFVVTEFGGGEVPGFFGIPRVSPGDGYRWGILFKNDYHAALAEWLFCAGLLAENKGKVPISPV